MSVSKVPLTPELPGLGSQKSASARHRWTGTAPPAFGDRAQADFVQVEIAAGQIPPGPVVRQARVGESLEPESGDSHQPRHGLDRVRVDDGVEAAGQD